MKEMWGLLSGCAMQCNIRTSSITSNYLKKATQHRPRLASLDLTEDFATMNLCDMNEVAYICLLCLDTVYSYDMQGPPIMSTREMLGNTFHPTARKHVQQEEEEKRHLENRVASTERRTQKYQVAQEPPSHGNKDDLPNELIIHVYHHLGDLDTAFHLARSCKRLNEIFEDGNNRLRILKSIIIKSDHHKHDIQLCHFLTTNQEFASNYAISNQRPDRSVRPHASVSRHIYSATANDLTDEYVWDIVCRWQALRVLQDLYRDRSIHLTYCKSVFPYTTGLDSEEALSKMCAKEGPLSLPNVSETTSAETAKLPFSFQETQRFYKALTAHWLAIETLRLSRTSFYDTSSERPRRFDEVELLWRDCHDRTLQETLDILEVYDFVYGFLVRKIFADVAHTYSWVEGRDEMLFYVELLNNIPRYRDWYFFVKDACTFLPPTNIIELLLLSTWGSSDRSYPQNKPRYLHMLGFFDVRYGEFAEEDDRYIPTRSVFSLQALERNVEEKIEKASDGNHGDFTATWKRYRRNAWSTAARGKVLFWQGSDSQIVNHMKGLTDMLAVNYAWQQNGRHGSLRSDSFL
ncbi:MAG: hypothetical protein M1834_001447 [Cirrosporium novae-zelandiae]|nr:MAG: hypothetical protein M1834_001447 [Cirrosporium novae-zelandiae]